MPDIIYTGVGEIKWETDNLLNHQVMDALDDLIQRVGPLAALQTLQELNQSQPTSPKK